MQTFRVDDMTCGHCVATITRAVQAADPDARVSTDLAHHLVTVESTRAGTDPAAAIADAGYTPVPVATAGEGAKPAKAGGCCGGCGCS